MNESRVAIGLEYDGSAFRGWQSQPDGRTVQDVLETALAGVASHPVRVHCAGRTDAGVHALAQVCHFDTRADRPLTAWVRGANARLPRQVAVRWARRVPVDFHARFHAVARSYRYLLSNAPVRPAIQAGKVGWFHHPLDLPAMRAAAFRLTGTHDFSAFRAAECQARSPVKTLYRLELARHGDLLVFDFRADAFLHHMVRNMVGALVYVGKGRHSPDWVDTLLASRDRSASAPTFGPEGLYLSGVEYEASWPLPDGGRIIGAVSSLLGTH